MSMMFAKEVVGTANAVTAGWGNLGGGVIQLVVGSGIFPLIKAINGGNASNAWRWSTVPPAVVGFFTGITIFFISEDAPKGNYGEMKKNGTMPEISAAASFRSGALNFNSWILFLQYAACFGVELTMNNAAALYFKEEFKQSTESAAAIASIFGWMNLFARGLGGFVSDKLSARMGMKGRIWAQAIMLFCEGFFVLIFANTKSLGVAIFIMVMFSIFVQGAEGSTFGIVPYVDPPATGSISGIVGAGGNIGAVLFGLCFRQLSYVTAFYIMGSIIMASSFASVFIIIKGSSSILCGGTDEPVGDKAFETIEVPEVDNVKMKEIETRDPDKGNVNGYEAEA
jgi:MFS transporter, NNP family, nitrate/nitrite transporter